jgi:hypothetical protein
LAQFLARAPVPGPDAVSDEARSPASSACFKIRLVWVLNETIFGNPRNQFETQRAYAFAQRVVPSGTLEAQMNHSFHSADRATHLKIVVVALVAGIAVAALAIAARSNVDYSQTAHVIKAGKPVVVTSSDISAVR